MSLLAEEGQIREVESGWRVSFLFSHPTLSLSLISITFAKNLQNRFMKKQLLALALFTLTGAFSQLNSQVIYSEDFDNIPGPTSGGAGTYVMAPGMQLRNVDNLTPSSAVSYVNEAWERREDFGNNVADSVAFSTSWYTPAGTANDFMWTPAIGVLPSNCILSWNAKAYDPMYPDGYEVRIMTVPPTGGTGVIGNQITSSTVLFSTPAESSAWTSHTVNLAAYTGQTVYIGFRNNSFDQFLLVVDDILVQVQINDDAGILAIDTANYTIEPKTQRTTDNIFASVRNNGSNTLTNVQLKLNVYDGAMTQVYTNTGASLASLAPSATATLSAGTYTPPAVPDNYTYEYVVLHSGADQVPGNDTMFRYLTVNDSVYARDDGTVTGSLGIGAGNGGYLGEQFQVVNSGKVSSVTFYATRGYTGTKMACVIWNMVGNVPSAIVASTDTTLYPDDSARVYTIPIHGGPMVLAPGMYAVTAVEFDSTLAVGLTNSIFRTGTTWVNWPTNPMGGWAHNEAFGSSFTKAYVIRPNFHDVCFNFNVQANSVSATCGMCADGSATSVPSNGNGVYTYLWSPGNSTAQNPTGLIPGSYIVTVTDGNGCSTSDTVIVGNTCSSYNASVTSATQASCGLCNDGTATVSTTNGTGPYTYLWTNGDTSATADSLLPGNYSVLVTDMFGCSDTANVTITFSTGISNLNSVTEIGVYPNPAEGNFILYIPASTTTNVEVQIYNSLGQIIIDEQHTAFSGGKIPFQINTPGIYTIKVRNENGVKAIPVLIK
jgi:hypothetical protein